MPFDYKSWWENNVEHPAQSGFSHTNPDIFYFSKVGKPNFLPISVTSYYFKDKDACLVSDNAYFMGEMNCNINKKENTYTFDLMKATCKKENPTDCEISGIGRKPSGRITYVKQIDSGKCQVRYRQGDNDETTLLPCSVDGDKINISVVHAKCTSAKSSHDGIQHNLMCEYQYLPSMACDCNGINACK